jgi:hypothetical protein
VDRDAADGDQRLSAVAIGHFSAVMAGGGGTAIVEGAHGLLGSLAHWCLPNFIKRHSVMGNVAVGALAYLVLVLALVTRRWRVCELLASAGDVVLMHPLLPHCTTPNTGHGWRYTFRIGTHVGDGKTTSGVSTAE